MTQDTVFPISFFDNVRQSRAVGVEHFDFDGFVEFLSSESQFEYPSKEAAPLFASVEFKDGHRLKPNILRSGLVILDVDDGVTLNEVESTMSELGVAGFIYTTASHREDHHKFRVGLPLASNVDASTYTEVWRAVNQILGGSSDTTKKSAESLFYLPGQYPGANGQFVVLAGEIAPADVWLEAVPSLATEARDQDTQSDSPKFPSKKRARRISFRDNGDFGQPTVHNSRIVPERAINQYLDTSQNWHHARFSFMCSVAARAAKNGFDLSSDSLVAIFNELDAIDGGFFQSTDDQRALLKDASNAINYVGG